MKDRISRRRLLGILLLGLAGCAQQRVEHVVAPVTSRQEANLRVFDAVWDTVRTGYYDPNFNGADWDQARGAYRARAAAAPDEKQLYGELRAMLALLRDAHMEVSSPTQLATQQARTRGRSASLGFAIWPVEGRYLVGDLQPESPAARSGIEAGWILTHWNSSPFDSATAKAGGYGVQAGVPMDLQFLDATGRVHRRTLTPQAFARRPLHRAQPVRPDVLYARLADFSPGTGEWLSKQLRSHERMRAVVLDLRGNPGGLTRELLDVLSPFYVEPTTVAFRLDRAGGRSELRLPGSGSQAFQGKVVVLADERSQSAAEIAALVIQETGRGQVVGRPTAGNVLNFEPVMLPDGGQLKLSVRDFRSPAGIRLEGRGVRPDVVTEQTLDHLRRGEDPDLSAALALLARQ